MTDTAVDVTRCAHDDAEPVDVRDHTAGGILTVALICRICVEQLPVWWGCGACETETFELDRRICKPLPSPRQTQLVRPCSRHHWERP